ncbi:hypothetical protein [Nocardia cerradoensis]|uniref:hypothetical protein n=1 Tax=Nocardia cerradoensis TaxID=85688 RepID=UPI001CB9419D|nr:hypothetical protein [Nocardia cerradoensis]
MPHRTSSRCGDHRQFRPVASPVSWRRSSFIDRSQPHAAISGAIRRSSSVPASPAWVAARIPEAMVSTHIAMPSTPADPVSICERRARIALVITISSMKLKHITSSGVGIPSAWLKNTYIPCAATALAIAAVNSVALRSNAALRLRFFSSSAVGGLFTVMSIDE